MSRSKEWEGAYFGENGAVKQALFSFASTLYGAAGSSATRTKRLYCVIGLLIAYLILRTRYAFDQMTASELDLLASFSRAFRQRKYAIEAGERALRLPSSHIDRLLLLCGLMRDWEAFFPHTAGGHESGRYFRALCEILQREGVQAELCRTHPAQMARIYRTLAWFTDKYGNSDKLEATSYASLAMQLASEMGAMDQVHKIKLELSHLLVQ